MLHLGSGAALRLRRLLCPLLFNLAALSAALPSAQAQAFRDTHAFFTWSHDVRYRYPGFGYARPPEATDIAQVPKSWYKPYKGGIIEGFPGELVDIWLHARATIAEEVALARHVAEDPSHPVPPGQRQRFPPPGERSVDCTDSRDPPSAAGRPD